MTAPWAEAVNRGTQAIRDNSRPPSRSSPPRTPPAVPRPVEARVAAWFLARARRSRPPFEAVGARVPFAKIARAVARLRHTKTADDPPRFQPANDLLKALNEPDRESTGANIE